MAILQWNIRLENCIKVAMFSAQQLVVSVIMLRNKLYANLIILIKHLNLLDLFAQCPIFHYWWSGFVFECAKNWDNWKFAIYQITAGWYY